MSVIGANALKPPKQAEDKSLDRDVLCLQEEFSDLLGAQVEIRSNKKGAGNGEIEFGDLDQLEGILQNYINCAIFARSVSNLFDVIQN